MARVIDIFLQLSANSSYYLEINESITDGITGDELHRYTWDLPGVSLHRDQLLNSPTFETFTLIKEGTNESISFKYDEVGAPLEVSADNLEVVLWSYIHRPLNTTGGGGGGGGNVVVTNTPLPITGTVAISGEVEVKNDSGNPLPVSVADGADVTQGAKADAAAGTDTGTFSIVSLIKRGLVQFTTFLTRIPATLTGSGNFRTAILEPLPAGTNALGSVTVSNEVEVKNDSGNPLAVSGTVDVGNMPGYAKEVHQTLYALNFGAQGDAAAVTDTGAASYIALFKRLLTRFTTFLSLIPASLTGSGNFRTAILEPLPAGTNALGSVTVSNEIEIKNDAGNPIPVTGTVIAELDSKLLYRNSALGIIGVQISNAPGKIHKIFATNVNGAERSIKFFDQVAAPTVGVDPILYTVTVSRVGQGGGTLDVSFEHPIEFTNALWVAATTSASDTANTYAGTDLIIQVSYE